MEYEVAATGEFFLYQYDLKGKTIIPFNTSAGYGAGSDFQTVKELCPGSKMLDGFEMKSGMERDGVYFIIKDDKTKEAETKVKNWLEKPKLIKEDS